MKRKTIYIAVLFLLCAIMTSACGYRLSGTGGLVSEGTRTIAIPVFINGTSEPYLDIEVTNAVVDEFMADGRLKVSEPDFAELVLRGRVTRFEMIALSYTVNAFVQQYRVRIVVDAMLEDLRLRKTIWQENGIEAIFIADYPVTYTDTNNVDIRQTMISKEAAIKKASRDIAWTLRSRVLEGF